MFLPRPRQLTALGKEGVYLEDQQEASISQRQDMPYIQAKRRRARGDSQEQEEVVEVFDSQEVVRAAGADPRPAEF